MTSAKIEQTALKRMAAIAKNRNIFKKASCGYYHEECTILASGKEEF